MTDPRGLMFDLQPFSNYPFLSKSTANGALLGMLPFYMGMARLVLGFGRHPASPSKVIISLLGHSHSLSTHQVAGLQQGVETNREGC